MLLKCGVGEDSWEFLGLQGDQTSQSKANHSWIFIEGTDAEVEAPILWPPHAKSLLIGKVPNAGKDWRQEEKEMTEDEMVGWYHWLDGLWASSGRWWRTGKPGILQSMWSQRGSFPISQLFDSLDSSPTPQFKSINSPALSLLYGSTLTSPHDYWKNHTFDSVILCQESNVAAFYYAV